MSTIISKPTTIQISMLGTHAFCEYRIYLELVMGFKARGTPEMLEGTKAHSRINTMAFLTRDSNISIEDALLQAESDGREITKRNVRVTGKILRGNIDEIHIGPKEITIIDDKKWAEHYPSYKNQVFGYCLAFKEQYNPKQPIYGAIKNYQSGKEVWKKQFSVLEEEYINGIVQRILGIIREDITPKPIGVREVCWQCGFKNYCNVRTR
ncbi:MAG: Dna2/Cas4 domain-containing protein [Dehalococcoidia bacterium]